VKYYCSQYLQSQWLATSINAACLTLTWANSDLSTAPL
jgi:hypothetical protein